MKSVVARLGQVNLNTIAPLTVVIVLIILTALVFRYSGSALGENLQQDIRDLLISARGTIWAPFAVIGVFSALGLTGFPQFLLIGITAAIFGPAAGFVYSWIATMVSSCVGFVIGTVFGADVLKRYGGAAVNDVTERISRRGLVSSMLVRVIPSAPFIVVNMIAGVARVPYWKFALGTGIGIIPKAAVIAFLGGSLPAFAESRDPRDLVAIGLVLILWIAIGVWVNRRFRTNRSTQKPLEDATPPPSGSKDTATTSQ